MCQPGAPNPREAGARAAAPDGESSSPSTRISSGRVVCRARAAIQTVPHKRSRVYEAKKASKHAGIAVLALRRPAASRPKPLLPPRGGAVQPAWAERRVLAPLRQACQRERERERRVSDADASYYGPARSTRTLNDAMPRKLHAKNNSLSIATRSLSQGPRQNCWCRPRRPTQTRPYDLPDPNWTRS
jgi:hypothetical protein